MSAFTLVVGNKNYSSWSLRAWLAMKATGADFKEELIVLAQEGYKAKALAYSPTGKVPVLKDGDITVWDSLAIAEYLAEQFPGLWPKDKAARALARSIVAEMHSGFIRVRKAYHMDIRHQADVAAAPVPETQKEIDRIQELWADTRKAFGAKTDKPFLFGDWSIADMFYAPIVLRFVSYAVALRPASNDYVKAILAHPHVKEWVEAGKKETWVIDFGH
ncbi:MAG: gst [Rickettsiales bacterium]|jgi:glutathione S-transferase|nr:gst [Rickettsiales bacterium]